TPDNPIKKVCPNRTGGNNYWPSAYSPRTGLLYIPSMTACEDVTNDKALVAREKDKGWLARTGGGYRVIERYESELIAMDPVTGELKKRLRLRYPNYSWQPAVDWCPSRSWTAPLPPTTSRPSRNCGNSTSARGFPRRR